MRMASGNRSMKQVIVDSPTALGTMLEVRYICKALDGGRINSSALKALMYVIVGRRLPHER